MTFTDNKKYSFTFEIANNHMGDVSHGKALLNEISKITKKYDYNFLVKFQFRDLETFIHPDYKGNHEFKFVKRFEETYFSDDQWRETIDHAKSLGFGLMCTPFDENSVPRVKSMGFDVLKIASCSFTDWPLLEEIAKHDLPIIASTAGCSIEEVDNVVLFFRNRRKNLKIMHCVGLYPTPLEQLNISRIGFLVNRYPDIQIGYSTHEDPKQKLPIALAIGQGATVFEKHVALPTEKYGINEYSSSMEDLSQWMESAHQSIIALNDVNQIEHKNEDEINTLMDLKRGVFAKSELSKGTVLRHSDIFLSIPPEKGQLLANDLSKYVEYTLSKSIEPNKPIFKKDLTSEYQGNDLSDIRKSVNELIKKSGVIIPRSAEMEISHHYGIEKFYKTGITMFTVVNREYCKKIITVLPGQNHPEQFHKLKEETFHVLYGDLELILDGVAHIMHAGDVITVLPEIRHIFSSKKGCVLEEISSTHIKDDSFYTDPEIGKNKNRKTFINSWVEFPF